MDCNHAHVDRSPETVAEAKKVFVQMMDEADTEFRWTLAEIEDGAEHLVHAKCLDCGQFIARTIEAAKEWN